jgi:hypothetical protein
VFFRNNAPGTTAISTKYAIENPPEKHCATSDLAKGTTTVRPIPVRFSHACSKAVQEVERSLAVKFDF